MNTYFRIDKKGYFNGIDQFYEQPEGWLEIRPPTFDFIKEKARWNGSEWIIEPVAPVEE